MNEDNNFDEDILEAISIIGFMLIYALLGVHSLPFLLLLFPTPFIYIGVKKDPKTAILGITIVSFLIGIIADMYSGIFLFELFMPLSLVIIYEIKTRKKSPEIIIYSTVVFFISCLLLYGLVQDVSGSSIITQLEESFSQIINAQVEIFEESGLTNYELLKTKNQLENTYSFMITIFPVILIIISMFVSYINYYVSAIVLRRTGIGVVSIPSFSRFKLPSNIIPGIILIFLALYIAKGLNLAKYDALVLNIIVFTIFIFTVQGLSVIDYMMIKRKWRLVNRIIIVILIAFVLPVGSVISLIGFFDSIFDFRKLRDKRS